MKTGRPSISWSEAVDEALCFGWIDGKGKSLGDESHTIRFTPRRANSIWSAVNVARVAKLEAEGRMQPAGREAFAARQEAKTGIYSHEQREDPQLGGEDERLFQANTAAWEFFQRQAPSYRKAAIWWVISAKQEATRRRRFETLVADSDQGRTVRPLTPPDKRR